MSGLCWLYFENSGTCIFCSLHCIIYFELFMYFSGCIYEISTYVSKCRNMCAKTLVLRSGRILGWMPLPPTLRQNLLFHYWECQDNLLTALSRFSWCFSLPSGNSIGLADTLHDIQLYVCSGESSSDPHACIAKFWLLSHLTKSGFVCTKDLWICFSFFNYVWNSNNF